MFCRSLLAFWVLSVSVLGQERSPKGGAVHAEMRNVYYHFTNSIAVHIVYLQGDLLPSGKAAFPVFDDPTSFRVDVSAAEITVGAAALANVLNQYAFAASDAPIKSVSVAIEKGKLKVRGRLRKGDVPFESEGSLSVTSDGEIRVHSDKIKAAHLPVKGLMDLLGENVAKLIDTGKARGIRADKDDLILNPAELFPPPHIHGRLSAITVRGDEIVQTYGGRFTPLLKISGNYMGYRGSQLQFGKLLMIDADLTLIDMNPEDPFDLFLDHYREQLAAGYTKITPRFGLTSYMRDYNKLKGHAR
jgi:hypothetical protein